MERVRELILAGLDSLAVDLVRPASVISDSSDRAGDVRSFSPLERLACTCVPAISGSRRSGGLIRLDWMERD